MNMCKIECVLPSLVSFDVIHILDDAFQMVSQWIYYWVMSYAKRCFWEYIRLSWNGYTRDFYKFVLKVFWCENGTTLVLFWVEWRIGC